MKNTNYKNTLEELRNNLLESIRKAVAPHDILGTYYRNKGEHYIHCDDDGEEYDQAPLVAIKNAAYPEYGGFSGNTVYELFVDKEDGQFLATLCGEDMKDFFEPVEHIQVEGLLTIYEWLVKYGFITEEPDDLWRCEECGSLRVECKVWADSNSETVNPDYVDSTDDLYCYKCEEHTCQVRESELMETIDEWWEQTDFPAMEKITGLRQTDFDPEDGCQAFVDKCTGFWSALGVEEKITAWNKYK